MCAVEVDRGEWAGDGAAVKDDNDIESYLGSKSHANAAVAAAVKLGSGSIKASMAMCTCICAALSVQP